MSQPRELTDDDLCPIGKYSRVAQTPFSPPRPVKMSEVPTTWLVWYRDSCIYSKWHAVMLAYLQKRIASFKSKPKQNPKPKPVADRAALAASKQRADEAFDEFRKLKDNL